MSLKATILGCGTSGGVPRIGNQWGACDPANPKNRRRRCALLVERTGDGGVTRVLVDTPPDLREQLNDADVGLLDGVLYTHDHADHVHGIDDLRMVAYNARRRVDVYYLKPFGEVLRQRFDYCFETPPGSEYPPVLNGHDIAPGEPVVIDGPGGPIEAMPFLQRHGSSDSLGFRFDGLAYSPDVSDFPEESLGLPPKPTAIFPPPLATRASSLSRIIKECSGAPQIERVFSIPLCFIFEAPMATTR